MSAFWCGLLLSVVSAGASDQYNFSAVACGALGGPLDSNAPDPGLGNSGYQLGFSWRTQPHSWVAVRLGKVDFSAERLGDLLNTDLTFVTIGGEYRFQESYYESGLYLGLGGYRLEGDLGATSQQETAFGLVFGVTSEFPVTERWAIVAELSAHWADLDQGGQVFAFLHAGVAFHF